MLSSQALEVAFVEDNYMIKHVPPAVAEASFGDAVLPKAAEARSLCTIRFFSEPMGCGNQVEVTLDLSFGDMYFILQLDDAKVTLLKLLNKR